MHENRDYAQDIAEIRSMMERSSKFLSLSGLAGVMAGMYALAGAWIAYSYFSFKPDQIFYAAIDSGNAIPNLGEVILLALSVLVLAVGTAIYLSHRKAGRRGETIWNATSRRLVGSMAVPLLAGGIFILILVSKGGVGLMAPLTLLFYGLAIYNASKYTYGEMKFLGLIQIALGLLGSWFVTYGLLFWAIGFGLVHILYGIYMHYSYEG